MAQRVFTNLARKAPQLGPGIVLPGWLHQDTCFTTLEVLRRERRRHAREKLRGLLAARGVATTSAALSGVLLAHAAQAAPAGLAASLAAASLTAALCPRT